MSKLYKCEECGKEYEEINMAYCSEIDGYECDPCNDAYDEREDALDFALERAGLE